VIGKTTTQPNIMLTVIRYQQSLTIFLSRNQIWLSEWLCQNWFGIALSN